MAKLILIALAATAAAAPLAAQPGPDYGPPPVGMGPPPPGLLAPDGPPPPPGVSWRERLLAAADAVRIWLRRSGHDDRHRDHRHRGPGRGAARLLQDGARAHPGGATPPSRLPLQAHQGAAERRRARLSQPVERFVIE